MNNNIRKDKITAIRILQQTYCATLVSSIKSLNELSDEDKKKLADKKASTSKPTTVTSPTLK